eukprot:418800_1
MSSNPKKVKKTKSKRNTKSVKPQCDDEKYQTLSLSKLQRILESPSYRANRAILKHHNFIAKADSILSGLSSDERRLFLNNHLNEAKLTKWNELKNRFMDTQRCSFQHTPLTVSFYNLTYAHTSVEASKIWYQFIHLMLDFEQGAAECDLTRCELDDCKRHLTIIDQLYAYVNTSDESLYGISTREFVVRGGFKLLLKAFNSAGVNNPIPPIILCRSEYKQHEFLQHFDALEFDFLYCISPNEVRFSWIKQMLRNGHPIMSSKSYVHQLLQKCYPMKKETMDQNGQEEEGDTADIHAVSMNEVGVLSWLLATLSCLLEVRGKQEKLLKKEFDKYEDTATNATLIDTMLDYLYWDQRYIHHVLHKTQHIILDGQNEYKMFTFIQNEYGAMISMPMFMKGLIELHMEKNRDVLRLLFDDDIAKNNAFYFKFIKTILNWNTMFSNAKMNQYLSFIVSKIVLWNSIDQPLFDELLIAILAYIERYVSNKSTVMKMIKQHRSKMVEIKRQQTQDMVSEWIIKIFLLLDNHDFTHQFMYHLGALRFKYQHDSVEAFIVRLYEQLVKEFDIDLVHCYTAKALIASKRESILWLLCRCCFDQAIELLLGGAKCNDRKGNMFATKPWGVNGTSRNVFLCLVRGVMPRQVEKQEQEEERIKIFRCFVETRWYK